MSLHFIILFWLAIIFIIAGTIVLFFMRTTTKKSKRESYLSFTVVFYIFGFVMLIYTLVFGLL